MQIEVDKKQQEISIKDEVPLQSKIVVFLMLINIVNMAIQIVSLNFQKNQLIYSLIVFLTLVSVVVVLFYLFKRSWKTKYSLTEIDGLESKKVFGRERIFLQLSNGKKRSFPALKTEEEVIKLKEIISSVGIKLI